MTGDIAFINQCHVAALSITPGLPLILAVGCFLLARRKPLGKVLPLAAIPALLTGFYAPIDMVVNVPWFFMGGRMGLDNIGRIFLISTAVVWLLAGISLGRNMSEKKGRHVLFGCFLTAMSGNFGLILAQEVLGFYLFFALMSFSVYGLVVFHKKEAHLRAGRIYIVMVMIGEVALFTALIVLAKNAESFAIAGLAEIACPPAAVILLYIGLGVKIGALPLHVWMPPAYQATPTPAAAALAGAMVNAGIFGWMRLLFPLHAVPPGWALMFILAGATAVFWGVILGFRQQEPGAVLACSSISQMGLATVIVGLGLLVPALRPQATVVITLFAVHHAFAKSSLFFGYDAFTRGDGKLSPPQVAALLLPALSLAGLPLTSGAMVKTGLKDFIALLGPPWTEAVNCVLSVSSVATTLLVLHFIRVLYLSRVKSAEINSGNHAAWYGSVTLVALMPWFWPLARAAAFHSLNPLKIWQSFWPVMLGCLLVLGWNRLAALKIRLNVPFPSITTGFFKQFAGPDKQEALRHRLHVLQETDLRLLHYGWRSWRHAHIVRRLGKIEKVFGRWGMVGLFYLALSLSMLFLL